LAGGRNNGYWNFGGTLGIAGADTACNTAFPGSAHCTRAQLEAIGAAGGIGATDTAGNPVTSLWVDDTTALDRDRCGSATGGDAPWTYGSGHLGCDGLSATVSGGSLNTIGIAGCGSAHHVGCCMP
jgi:hypothetical protein